MISSVGLEVMNSTNPELNWKTVTKGRRSRKSVARSLNSVVKVGNCTSPKRVGDFSGSDSDKFGEVVLGQSNSGKSENVPLKKRRHLLQSPSPRPWTSSLRHQDSASPRTRSSSPMSENHEKHQYPSCSSVQRSSNWHLRGIEVSVKARGGDGFDDGFLHGKTESEYNEAGDFSGIELLAAAASMDDDPDNADKKDLPLEDSSMPKNSDASSSATLSKEGLKNKESEFSSINMNAHGGNMDCSQENNSAASESLSGSPEDGTVLKVSRHHWDLNTLMDAWDEPYDALIVGDTSKDANDDMQMEGRQKDSRDDVYSNPGGTRDESSNLKIEENKSTSVSEDRICREPSSLEEHLQEPPKSNCSNAARGTSDLAGEKDPDNSNFIQVLNCDADMKISNEVTISDAVIDSSPFTKICCTSGILMSEEKTNSISGTVAIIQDENCTSNVVECERSTAPDGIHTRAQDVNAHDMTASEAVIDVRLEDTEDSQETFELPGTVTRDAQPIVNADLNKLNDGAFLSGSKIADCPGYIELAEFDTKHEDNDHPNEGLKRNTIEDTCKSFVAGAQCDNPTTSVGRIGFPIDGWRDSDVSQDNHVHTVHGDDLTGFQEGYDSPYEDGELRGSFLCSWEDNEMENECVDYESDGRNGDGSDAADYPGSEIVEGGSEGSHGTRRSLSLKISAEGKSKSGPVKHSLRKHFVKDDSDNNEIAGKGSNAGSGTTVEQCMEIVMDEDDNMKRRQLIDRRDEIDVKGTDIDEYASKMTIRGKLQSRIEGRSSADATDRKDVFFMQQCRPGRLGGSYSRAERDICPDRYMGRYRSTTHGERDGVNHWASWGPRKRFTSNYQGAEGRNHTRPRSKIGESAEKIDGLDFHDPRPTANYLSKGQHRPLMRRSPVERDDYFVGRRIPLTRGVSNYRGRGHYSQRAGRDFLEDFEPLPDDAGVPVRMPRYLSRRERSFSPSAGRSAHMTFPRRRSRSRSRTRSPRAWHPHRERILGGRRHSRSPEFRSEARMERMRLPFSKPAFASDCGNGYMSPPRGRFSPQRNLRWVDDRNFSDNHIRRRRSPPVRVFRRTQRFDAVGPSGRLKSDEYFRPISRPGRFSFMANGGRECKIESNYDDRRRDDSGEMMHHRVVHSDDAGNVRRFRHNAAAAAAAAADDFETNKLNNEDDVRVADPRDVPQTQGEREDKRAFNIS